MSQPKPPTPDPAGDYSKSLKTYMKFLPQLLEGEQAARTRYDPMRIQQQQGLQRQYGPEQYREQREAISQIDPGYLALRGNLMNTVSEGLSAANAGRLPAGLEESWNSMARASGVAHGNTTGNAPAAFEDIFKGQNLLNYRQQAQQNVGAYLAGSTPEQLAGLIQPVTPDRASAYVNPSAPGQLAAPNYQNTLAAWQASGAGRNPWAGALGGAVGGATAGAAFGPYGAAGGAIVGGVGGYFSDLRIKSHIIYVGRSLSGIPIAEFEYKGSTRRYRGCIAQDLLKIRPDAVTLDKRGLYKVLYHLIDVAFEEVGHDGKKTCKKCHQIKPLSEFYRREQIRYRDECKLCQDVKSRQWGRQNLQRLRASQRAADKRRRRERPEHYRAIARVKDRKRQPQKTIYMRERRRNNPNFRSAAILRSGLSNALKGRSGWGWEKCIRTLGCSLDDFRLYVETQFEPGMTWQNYGTYWEIDHIMPCALFDLTDPAQQRVCFHFSNLRPLEKQVNRTRKPVEVT